jgi:hypothetical protein
MYEYGERGIDTQMHCIMLFTYIGSNARIHISRMHRLTMITGMCFHYMDQGYSIDHIRDVMRLSSVFDE